MNKQLFTEYIASFNRDDFEGFSQYYADEAGLAAEVATEFHALADWPDFIAGPIRKGESIRSTRLSTGTT